MCHDPQGDRRDLQYHSTCRCIHTESGKSDLKLVLYENVAAASENISRIFFATVQEHLTVSCMCTWDVELCRLLQSRPAQQTSAKFGLYAGNIITCGTVSEMELFHCTVPELLIRKRYYVLFLIPVFIAQVTKLVQFT
jgi:hypothetical protein